DADPINYVDPSGHIALSYLFAEAHQLKAFTGGGSVKGRVDALDRAAASANAPGDLSDMPEFKMGKNGRVKYDMTTGDATLEQAKYATRFNFAQRKIFHGTSASNAQEISRTGMKKATRVAMGEGAYFTPMYDAALGYAQTSRGTGKAIIEGRYIGKKPVLKVWGHSYAHASGKPEATRTYNTMKINGGMGMPTLNDEAPSSVRRTVNPDYNKDETLSLTGSQRHTPPFIEQNVFDQSGLSKYAEANGYGAAYHSMNYHESVHSWSKIQYLLILDPKDFKMTGVKYLNSDK
ncbi:hypothetical protein, partial [Kitasatospora sp. MBT63]|uniref:hypothetical protein n=1 Tax=Kitasatospora sp. MBT63 TaxID=1444768 RepID=UPI001314FC81